MEQLTPDRPYASCGACNCMPGYCEQRERIQQAEVVDSIQKAFAKAPLSQEDVDRNFQLLKNRRQRRYESRMARRGPPAKKRR